MIEIRDDGVYLVRGSEVKNIKISPDEIEKIKEGNLELLSDLIAEHPNERIVLVMKREDLREYLINLAKRKMQESIEEDYILTQVLSAYDDITAMINLISERIHEFEVIEEIKSEEIEECTMLRKELENLQNLRDYLQTTIESKVKRIAPNLSELVGEIIAARLINLAGGLKRLSAMPASTIQVLGAEDAFFQHLRKGTPCPKHGVIFQIAEIRNAPKKKRGKIARALAGKIAIAARVDYYGGEFVADKLKEEFKNRVEEIKNDTGRKGR